jgi:hypothetical protein
MFDVDDSPARVSATPAAAAHLRDLAARTGELTVLLTDDRVRVLVDGQPVPSGSLRLGRLDDAVTFAADSTARTAWWRNRADIDLTEASPRDGGLGFALTALSEPELYAAVACGPLPRI